jgi:hypothetical protein
MVRTRLALVWVVIALVSLGLKPVSLRYPAALPWVMAGVGAAALAATCWLVRRTYKDARELSDYDAELRQVCPGCGYDMRATPLRRPECGREPQMTDASPAPGFTYDPPGRRRRR